MLDNGTAFVSEETGAFYEQSDVQGVTFALYHSVTSDHWGR